MGRGKYFFTFFFDSFGCFLFFFFPLHQLIDCVNISFELSLNLMSHKKIIFFSYANLLSSNQLFFTSSYLLFGTSLRDTQQPSDTHNGPSQEIIIFIKGNLFFNRYFFIFLSSPSFTGFLYESHYVCVGCESYRNWISRFELICLTRLINSKRYSSERRGIGPWHSLVLH